MTTAPASASASRKVILDGARGYLLVAMFVAHFCIDMRELGADLWLNKLRHSHFLPVGDIEFFLPLSGIVSALAYRRAFADGRVGRAIWSRMRVVYLYQLAATVLIILLVRWGGITGVDLRGGHGEPTELLLLRSFSLAVMPEYLDILVLNLALLPFVPLAFALLARGQTAIFFGALAGAWVIARLGVDGQLSALIVRSGFDWHQWIGLMGHFNPLSYAVLFFGGFYLGHRFKADPAAFAQGFGRPRPILAIVAAAVVVVYFIGYRSAAFSRFAAGDYALLSPNTAAVTVAVYYLIYALLAGRALPRAAIPLAVALRGFLSLRLFVFLGQSSLFVYAAHVIVLALAKSLVMYQPWLLAYWSLTLLCAAGLALIWAVTLAKKRLRPAAPRLLPAQRISAI